MTYKLHRMQQRTSMEGKGGGEKEGEKKGMEGEKATVSEGLKVEKRRN